MTFVKKCQIVGFLYIFNNICLTNDNFYEFGKYIKIHPLILRKNVGFIYSVDTSENTLKYSILLISIIYENGMELATFWCFSRPCIIYTMYYIGPCHGTR
jgi:hypothetical protein